MTVKSSFGNLDSLINNAKNLKEIADYINTNKKIYDETQNTSQFEQILSDLGYFNIITKDESGDKFYDEIAKQIYEICNKLFPLYGGIISLLDVYYIYNKKRTTCLISCDELIEACKKFKNLGLGAQLLVYDNNIKVIESTSFNQEEDYSRNIGKHLSYENGISAEDLARKLGISVLIARIKLQKAVQMGKVAIDDRIEGMRYFKNLILDIKQ